MYKVYVQGVCTRCMYRVCVQGVCTGCVYKVYVQGVCTGCTYKVYIQGVCTRCMYKVYVQGVCTVLWAGKSPSIRSCIVHLYGSGQPYTRALGGVAGAMFITGG